MIPSSVDWPGAVAVVEEVLGLRLVDRHDREAELAVALERLQPDHAGRGLLGAGDHVAELLASGGMENADHVGAVVHRDVRLVVDRSLDVLVVRVVVLALDRERRDAVLLDQGGCDVILSRERVGRADDHVRSARLERPHQVRRLGRHVQARRDPVAGQRELALEALADRGQHRHLPVGPGDPAHALGGESQILHVISLGCGHLSLSSGQRSSVGGSSGDEKPLVLALLPVHPVGGRSAAVQPGLDGAAQRRLAAKAAANASSSSSTAWRSRRSRSERS